MRTHYHPAELRAAHVKYEHANKWLDDFIAPYECGAENWSVEGHLALVGELNGIPEDFARHIIAAAIQRLASS